MRPLARTLSALFLAVATPLLTGSLFSAESEGKIKVLIVTGFDVGSHQWEASARAIAGILKESGRFEVTIAADKEAFASPDLSDYGAVVLNFGFWNEPEPSESAKTGLLNYASNGGGVVALHFASSAFQDWSEYGAMLGRWWKKDVGGHGPYSEFEVNIKDADHPITQGLTTFKIEDELYAKLSGDEEIQVLASAYSDWSDKVEPIVFVKRHGKGRVVHDVLGHSADSKRNASYQKLLVRGVEWAATGGVTAN